MTTAIQLTRYGLAPLLLERRELGGLLWNANLVENYPGFPNGVRGEKLIGLMKRQMERIGVIVKREAVTNVDWQEDLFIVKTNHTTHNTQYVIVATGTKSKPLPNIISPEARERVFTEVWPLADVTGKQVVIIGTGDAAFDYGLNLSKNRNFVTILNRGETVKCLALLFERAAREPRIRYMAGKTVQQITINEEKPVEGIRPKVRQASAFDIQSEQGILRVVCEAETFEADHVVFAIGRVANRDFLSEEVRRREQELVEAGRLYFAGDVKNELFRQVAIAAGDGLRTAMQIYSRITNENFSENR